MGLNLARPYVKSCEVTVRSCNAKTCIKVKLELGLGSSQTSEEQHRIYYRRKKIDAYKKVGKKQNIITFFLLEIGQKFKQV
jgi:hypothetical protein